MRGGATSGVNQLTLNFSGRDESCGEKSLKTRVIEKQS